MASSVNQGNVGNAGNDASAASLAFTTTALLATGDTFIVPVTWGDKTVTLSSVTGGGLTFTIDKQGVGAVGNQGFAVVSAPLPAGLASGTTITANYSAATVGRGVCGLTLSGCPSVSPVDVTSGPTDFNTTTAWTTASMTILAGSTIIAVVHCSNTNDTSTITAPSAELQDFGGGAGTFGMTVGGRSEIASGSFVVAGTWSGSEIGTVGAVAYKASLSTGAVSPRTFQAIPVQAQGRNL